jgi:hypothetical protein
VDFRIVETGARNRGLLGHSRGDGYGVFVEVRSVFVSCFMKYLWDTTAYPLSIKGSENARQRCKLFMAKSTRGNESMSRLSNRQ